MDIMVYKKYKKVEAAVATCGCTVAVEVCRMYA